MENFAKDKFFFRAAYSKQGIHSRTYQLQDWYTSGMDARQTIHLRDCLPYRIKLLTSERNPSGKNAIASAGIAQGPALFFTTMEQGATGVWRKGTAPFILSASLDLDLWVTVSPEGDRIELCFFPVPVLHEDGGIVSIRKLPKTSR